MIRLKEEETKIIKGGFDPKILTIVITAGKFLFELGQALGTAIRRGVEKKSCPV